MQDLIQSGTITSRFVQPVAYLAINPSGGPGAPVWQVINYNRAETVTIAAAPGSAGSVSAFAAHTGRTTLTVGGMTGGVLDEAIAAARALDGAGSVSAFLGPTAAAAQQVQLMALTQGGTQYLYAARPAASGLSVFEVGAGGALTPRGTVADSSATYGAGITALASAVVGGARFLYAGSGSEHGITAYAVAANGALTAIDSDGAAEGLPLQGVSALKTVAVGGATFLLAAAAGSSSLTVLRIEADGRPVAVDHLVDDLGTRFGGVQAMDALVAGGRAFVALGGGDDGVSLFALDPGGMLVHLCTVADSAGAALADISALRLAVVGGELQLLAASASEPGLTVLRVDLAAAGATLSGNGATLSGTAGADLLFHGAGAGLIDGGAGDDILIDGPGADSLRGGAGRDVFVPSFDGGSDTILDFDPAEDRIDLSRWPMLYDPARQIGLQVTATGAILRYLGETLEIVTAAGRPLSAAEVAALPLLPATRVPLGHVPAPPPANPGVFRNGGAGADTLTGGPRDDTLNGNGGDDVLEGRGGADLFYGGAGRDTVTYQSETAGLILNLGFPGESTGAAAGDAFASIEAFVGTGLADTLRGDALANDLSGGGGNDLVEGFGGADSLFGGDGDDTLRGMDGNDLVVGGAGVDAFFGGAGEDTVSYAGEVLPLAVDRTGGPGSGAAAGETWEGVEVWWLGAGDDRFRGGAEGERVLGGAGADVLEGFGGDDRLEGQDGNDTLSGGEGNDTLLGGAGDDVLAGGAGGDSIDGGAGGDSIGGGEGNDLLRGGSGNDTFGGGPGEDTIWGEEGDDYLSGGESNDVLYGGDGNDGFSGSFGADLIFGGAGNDDIGGGAGRDTVHAEDGNDTMGGGEGDDLLDGGSGDDFVAGGPGRDTLFGGEGADRLVGGPGNDVLWGGAGADTFVFGGWTVGEIDRIEDFEDGIDRINAQGVPGGSAAARLAALAPSEVWIDGVPHVQFGLNGHAVLVAGMTLAQLDTGDFIFT